MESLGKIEIGTIGKEGMMQGHVEHWPDCQA
jgi:hypothetical protein